MPFKPGHAKVGGRAKGSVNKITRLRQEAAETIRTLGQTPEAIDGILSLQAMLAVMTARLKAGDHDGALLAAEAAAPYVHPKLASTDVRVTNPNPLDSMSDEELIAKMHDLERKIQLAADRAEENGGASPLLSALAGSTKKKLLPH
jgi:hypothetical protein